MKNNQNRNRWVLLIICLIAICECILIGPIVQDPNYHLFADQRSFFSIHNFCNVVSNIPFIIIGLSGILQILFKKTQKIDFQLVIMILIFFIGVFFTGIGSGYYHLKPSNDTLFWDRLPMTISFMSFFSIVISEFISIKLGTRLFIPLLICGILSLLYWQISEKEGVGDLRFYALVQFLPILLITAILILYKNNNGKVLYCLVLSTYLMAKLFEINDHLIFSINHTISGHSIKHLIAAAAPLLFLIGFRRQKTYFKLVPINLIFNNYNKPNH